MLLYQMNDYFGLILVGNLNLKLIEQTNIRFVFTLVMGNATNWWHVKVQLNNVPQKWQDFKEAFRGVYSFASYEKM